MDERTYDRWFSAIHPDGCATSLKRGDGHGVFGILTVYYSIRTDLKSWEITQ